MSNCCEEKELFDKPENIEDILNEKKNKAKQLSSRQLCVPCSLLPGV